MVDFGDDYDDNSSRAVFRVALAVAFSDDLLDHEEQAKVEEVYRGILVRMDEYDEDGDVEEECESIAQDVMGALAGLDSDADREELYAEWAELVTDPDMQEIALVAALLISAEDADIDPEESACMSAFCDIWGLDFEEMLASFAKPDL